ncbi:MAG: DUF58 domain-containing protein [Oscillospiraceae bacterium]|nr:DUF58 domain-containing protein [Oscillospiraceae bacterium]
MKRARVYYLFAVLLSVFFIMTLYHRITVVFFAAVFVLPMFSGLLMLLNYAFVKFEVSVDKKIYDKRESASTVIRISNEGILPVPFIKIKIIQIDDNGKNANENIYALSIAPLKSVDFKNDIVMKRRGLYEVGIRSVEIYDMFGLFKFRRTLNIIEEILVLPKRILLYGDIGRSITSEDGEEKNKRRIGEDRTIISHIRDYAEGDNINSVHWKLSAKKHDAGELIVKVYDRPNETNVMIIADMQVCEFDDPDLWEESGDAVVEASLAIALKCVYESKSCVLYWYDAQQSCIVWYEIASLGEFNTAFNHLAVSQASFDNITAETILKNYEICDARNKIIYVINQGFDLNTADILSSLATLDESEINCLCIDLKDKKETSDFINELCVSNVNAVKFTGSPGNPGSSDGSDGSDSLAGTEGEFKSILNDFIR